jgi:hypothetical protein
MIDNDALIMISIFEQVRGLEPKPTTAEDYLEAYGPEIDGIGRVFELLGLAKASDTCELGWKPTEALLRLIANRAVQPFNDNGNIDRCELIESMFDFAIRDLGATNLGDKDNMFVEQVTEFGCEMLRVLGLVQSDVSGYKPSRVLQELVFERYLEAASKQLKDLERGACLPNIT